MFDILSMIFWTILVLSILVFFHEFGHFLAAKISGIRVVRFSVGFPPRLFGKQIGDTDYCISATPLGGYCKMAGMIDETLDSDGIKGEPWEFNSKPIPIKMFVLIAGPLMNIILAIVMFAGIGFFSGIPIELDDSSTIGNVTSGTAAERAGLLAGDKIIGVDDVTLSTWAELTGIISVRPDETVLLEIDRNGELLTFSATIDKRDNPSDDKVEEVGMLGIERAIITERLGLMPSIKYGWDQTWFLTTMITKTLKMVLFGEESMKSLGGPIMIAKFTDESRKSGMETLIRFMAFLSLNLGFMNLLPIPVLDGGHLMILSAEAVARRQLPLKLKLIIQQLGMAFILVLIVVIFYNDIMRFMSPG